MARRATPVTKGRTAPKKATAPDTSAPEAAKPARRGNKSKPQDELPIEALFTEPAAANGDDSAHVAEASPRKGKRGPKLKPDLMSASPEKADDTAAPEIVANDEPELPEMEAKTPEPPPSPRKTRRNREPEASAPPPLDIPDEPPAEAHGASAAEWHPETGTVTFDWPLIEQVADAEGPNQPMAKLLLAARAEGARSRWPF